MGAEMKIDRRILTMKYLCGESHCLATLATILHMTGIPKKCARCKKTGATVGCEVKKCRRSYHYPCAVKDNAENIEDDDEGIFKIYCKSHKTCPHTQQDGSDESDSVGKIKRPRLSLRVAMKRIADDSSTSDESQNSIDPEQGPLESDLEDSRDLRENSPILDELGSDLTDEPKPSISGAFQHNGAKSTAKPPAVVEKKANNTDGTELTKNQESKDQENLHCRDADDTDIDSDQESQSLLIPLMITRVESLKSDQSSTSARDQQSNLPPPTTPNPPRPASAAFCGPLSTNSNSSPCNRASVSGSVSEAQGTPNAAQFWTMCREAGCVETIFHGLISAMNGILERILSDQASEEDCALSLRVLQASGMLPKLFEQQDRECGEKLLSLQREMERLSKARSSAKSAATFMGLN